MSSPEPLIEVEAATKRFGAVEVLRGVTLSIPEGKTTVVLGRTGSGKSVFIKLLNALYLPDDGAVRLMGRDTRTATPDELADLRGRVGTMFQSYALFDAMNVADNIAFPLREERRLAPAAIAARVDELLSELGLSDARNLLPAELSGGMRKRVSLARALARKPSVLLCDEPTTGLDPILIEAVDDMLIEARQKFGVTQVIISHDMASVFRLADQVALLSEGRIAFAGTPDELRASDNPDVRAFLALSTSRLSESSTAQPVEAEAAATNPLAVQVSGLVKSFSGRAVLRSVNFTAEQGRITSLIGGSGSGKSVLMKHLLGLLRPDAGTVSVLGSDVLALPDAELRALRRRIGMLFQGAALFDSLSVFDNCAFPLREAGERLSLREATPVVTEVLERLSLAELARRMPSELSAGQRKRVALARALVTRPEMLIYDEPTTGLDPVLTASVNEMIVEAQENFGVTSVVVSHDMAGTFRISHSVAMLYQGELLLQGTPADFMQSADERIRAFVFAGSAAEA